jgi:O-antigen biosynthesis protein WbqP
LNYDPLGKRILDVLLAGSALIPLSPLLILVVLAIKASDRGPVIFVQTRIGKDGLPFKFFKFRSMPEKTGDIPSDQLGTMELSRVGKIIRRANVDELPQLFNILKGDMSLVGPRPPIPDQLELLELRRESGALACRPGLTGLAQVCSFDGMSVAVKARYDEEYAQKITFWGDLSIILRTFAYVFKKPPVY